MATKKKARRPGRPSLPPTQRRKATSIRLTDKNKSRIIKEFGSVQAWVDHNLECLQN